MSVDPSDVGHIIDVERLREWMDDRGLGEGTIEAPHPLGGGTQNILLAFRRAARDYVLRCPPREAIANGNVTMRKEARVLGALRGTDIPHPRLIAACEDASVLGVSFYLMERVNGFNPAVAMPPLHASDARVRHRMGFALVEALAQLGSLDHVTLGLGDLGKVEGFLERQVGRWRSQLESYAKFEGWPGPADLRGLTHIERWLEAHRPKTFTPGIMHGDFHLANVMYRYDSPELAAIVDWELTTVGDPLVDVGWMLALWPDDVDTTTEPLVKPWDGFPTSSEMLQRYAHMSSRGLSDIRWYRVFACYKLGIILEGTHARACAGKASRATGEMLHRRAVSLFARAQRLL